MFFSCRTDSRGRNAFRLGLHGRRGPSCCGSCAKSKDTSHAPLRHARPVLYPFDHINVAARCPSIIAWQINQCLKISRTTASGREKENSFLVQSWHGTYGKTKSFTKSSNQNVMWGRTYVRRRRARDVRRATERAQAVAGEGHATESDQPAAGVATVSG